MTTEGKATGKDFPRRLRWAGLLIAAGLAIEAATLCWPHPTAFLAFLLAGGALAAGGIGLYLWSLVST